MESDPLRVLIIDDEKPHAEAVAESLARVGYECVIATSGKAGADKIEKEDFDVILTDLRMEDIDGLALLRKAKQDLPDSEVVLITGHGDVKTAVEAIKEGASNYLTKPVDMGELRAIVDKAGERLRLARANRELQRQLDEKFGFEGVVGNSAKMHDIIAKLRDIAPTIATVMLQGETGTGKELVAKAIHTNSPRKNKPFVAMNCTALNENLSEDELFGHDPGSVTGAERLRKGRLQHAQGGTLDLNDIQEGDSLRSTLSSDNHSAGPSGLVGRPLNEVERFYIEQTLGLTGGNREEAARLLGIGERTLYRKIKKWELEKRPAVSQEKDT